MDCCLQCDHLRIHFDISDLDISPKTPEKTCDVQIRSLIRRDRITRIRCRKGLIVDSLGLPKEFCSLASLSAAEERPGECPHFCGEEEDEPTGDTE